MELWLRYRNASDLEADEKVSVTSQAEWRERIYDPRLISSVLWPDQDLFPLDIRHKARKHPHEVDYINNPGINQSYRNACRSLAERLERSFSGARALVYAPLRGAYPIWRGIRQFIRHIACREYYPVTSSFISYPPEFGICNKKKKPASGRFNNRFELERIRPMLSDFDYLFYVDEIISGSMMRGHLKDMFRIRMEQQIPLVAIGLADAHGTRSPQIRNRFEGCARQGKLHSFFWEGCDCLITEDQKFLLGIHYVDYQLGPHIVPLMDSNMNYFQEKIEFDKAVFARPW